MNFHGKFGLGIPRNSLGIPSLKSSGSKFLEIPGNSKWK